MCDGTDESREAACHAVYILFDIPLHHPNWYAILALVAFEVHINFRHTNDVHKSGKEWPDDIRAKIMSLHGDTKIVLTIDDDQVRLSPIGHGISRAEALYREHAKHHRNTDDFLNDRVVEAPADDNGPIQQRGEA